MQTTLRINGEDHVVQVRVPAVNQDLRPWNLLLVTHVCEEGRRGNWGRETADICVHHKSNCMGAYIKMRVDIHRDGVSFPPGLLL